MPRPPQGPFGRRGWLAGVARSLELPAEVLLDLPRFVCLGGREFVLENHRGVLEYTPTRIRIRVQGGELAVEGTALRIEQLTPAEIAVSGRIRSLHLHEGPKKP